MKSTLISGMFTAPIAFVAKRARSSALAEHRNVGSALIVAIVGALAVLPIVIFGIPNGADLPNHLRFVLPFYEALQSGHFHPGWLAESNYGLGDLRFMLYPPGLYYLMSASRTLTGEWYSAAIVTFVLLSITGGLGAYLWARYIFDPRLAMWAGILYTLAPYRLNELYQASLLSEYAGCSILPFAFAFVERVIKRKSISDVVGLGASYALLILMNVPVAFIGSIALGVYALLRLERQTLLPTIWRLALGILLGLAASSFFWTSLLAELSWIKGHAGDPNPYYDYQRNFLFSPSALTNRNTWYANILALAAIGFLLPGIAFIIRSFKRDKSHRALNASFLVLLATFFMATGLSKPVWAVVPKLSEVQFPWRWLSVVSLMGAMLFAGSIPRWTEQFRGKLRPRDLAVGLVFALSLVFIATQIIVDCDYLARAKFEPMAQEVRGAVSFKDWLPIWAKEFHNVEKLSAKAEAGARPVTVTAWEAERRALRLESGAESTVRVQTYFYPHWKARAGSQVLPTSASADGLLVISAPTQAVDIELSFERPIQARVFEMVTIASWLMILSLLILAIIKAKRSLNSGQRIDP